PRPQPRPPDRAVPLIALQQARRRVAGNVQIGIAVVVEVRGDDAESVAVAAAVDPAGARNVGEAAVAFVVKQEVLRERQSPWSTDDRRALPLTEAARAGQGSRLAIEREIVGDHQVESAVAVVVNECAADIPSDVVGPKPGSDSGIAKRSVAVVAIQDAVAVVGDEQVAGSVAVVVADAGALAPSGAGQAG